MNMDLFMEPWPITKTKQQFCIHPAEIERGKEILPIAVANIVICGIPTLMFCTYVFEAIGGTWVSGRGNEMSIGFHNFVVTLHVA